MRSRLRAAIAARGAATAAAAATAESGATAVAAPRAESSLPHRAVAPAAPPMPAFPDDWFLRRGRFAHGPVHDTAWAAELDAVTRWLDDLPLGGRILEPAAGVGFFSPLLATKGQLHASDPDDAALDMARARLVAHRLRAHLHVADPWGTQPPADDAGADALVAALLLGRVRGAGLDVASASLRRRLRPGGQLAVVELLLDPAGGPPPGIAWTYHEPAAVEAALGRAGFAHGHMTRVGRFFWTASATAA